MKAYLRVFSGMIADFLGGTVTTLIILRISRPEELGIYSRILSLALLGSSIALLGIDVLMRIYLPRGEEVGDLIGFALIMLSIFSLAIFFIEPYSSILAFLSGAYLLQISRYLALRDYSRYLKIVLARRLPQPIIVPLAFYYYGPDIAALAIAITYLPSITIIRYASIGIPKGLSDVFYSFLSRLLSALTIYLDKVLIALLYGYLALGVYYFVRQVNMILTLPIVAFDRFGVQEISAGKRIEREFFASLLIVLLASIGVRIFRGYTGLFFPNYAPYAYLLRVTIPFGLFRGLAAYEKAKFLGKKELKLPALAQGIAMIFAISTIILSKGSLTVLVCSQFLAQLGYRITLKITYKYIR